MSTPCFAMLLRKTGFVRAIFLLKKIAISCAGIGVYLAYNFLPFRKVHLPGPYLYGFSRTKCGVRFRSESPFFDIEKTSTPPSARGCV